MAFVRTKKIKGNTYYYLVESKRVKGKVKQQTIVCLGKNWKTIREAWTGAVRELKGFGPRLASYEHHKMQDEVLNGPAHAAHWRWFEREHKIPAKIRRREQLKSLLFRLKPYRKRSA